MRIVIPITGSRGDVQPYVALGKGLQEAGHDVRVATHTDFEPAVRAQGLDFVPVGGSSRAMHTSEGARRMVAAGGNPFTYLKELALLRRPVMNDLMAGTADACRDADLVLLTQTALLLGLSAAEKWGAPACVTALQPVTPSRSLGNALFPECPWWLPGRRAYNFLSHLLAGGTLWAVLRPAINAARRDVLDLPPYPLKGPPLAFFRTAPTLVGYSERVIPRPPDWAGNQHVTGYWFVDSDPGWQPPAPLRDFLASGPPPVCVGFGSMSDGEAEGATEILLKALAETGQRALLLTGWGALKPARDRDRVFAAEAVPHDWLFPRAAAVVHHGGAGTTAAGLRAGVPSLAVPFAGDQFFWGRRLAALGVGPRPIPRRRLTVEALAAALRTLTGDEAVRRRAAAVGADVRAEDGVGRAVELLAEHVPGFAPRAPVLRRSVEGAAARVLVSLPAPTR